MNYLNLLLTITFIVGCTDVEDASITVGETDPQEVTTVNINKDSEKEGEATVVDEPPVIDEAPTLQNNELFSGYNLIEVDCGDLFGYREPKVVVDIEFKP